MVKIVGAREVRARLAAAGRQVREEALVEIERSAREMHSDVQDDLDTIGNSIPFYHGDQSMRNITGRFRRFYRYTVYRRRLRGIVGLYTAAGKRVFYARFFFYGTKNQPARPVHDEEFERQAPIYIGRQRVAMANVLRRLFP